MPRFLVALLVAVMLVMGTGCGSYWSNLKKDPVTQVSTTLSTLDSVITIASVIFGEVKPLLPEGKRNSIQQRFSHAVLGVEAAKRALREGLEVAKEANDESPNFVKLMQDALQAANELRTLVREMQQMVKMDAPSGSAAAPPAEPDDLDAAVESLGYLAD